VLPTQLITKPLAIEVLDRGRNRVKQIVAPVGAALPGAFHCTCRTVDQAGRIVVPIFEENRIIKRMIIDRLDKSLPIGSPVDVEFHIDVRHTIEVRVNVREANRSESITLEGPPAPHVPSAEEIREVQSRFEQVLQELTGSVRTRLRSRFTQVLDELREARYYEDNPKAIQRLAELRELLQEAQTERGRQLEPPWPHFAQLLHHCRGLADEVARETGHNRLEMLDYLRAQERQAERAFHERNQALYRECWQNLQRYAFVLQDLCRANDPGAEEEENELERDPVEKARETVEQLRGYLSAVWKEARARGRKDLEQRLAQIARQSQGLGQRAKDDPYAVLRTVRRLFTELSRIEELTREGRGLDEGDGKTGLLEGLL
jgi:hypothetical protein